MAQCSHSRALQLSPLLVDWPNVYGVSCTATIVSHYKRRGDYRAHIAVSNSFNETSTLCFTFKKGFRRRHEEEAACANLALYGLFEMIGHHDVSPSEFAVCEEEPKLQDRTNEVGEVGEGLETPPKLVPLPPPSTPLFSVLIQQGSRTDRPLEVKAPAKLPNNTVVVFPQHFDLSSSFNELLDSENLHREGAFGKSWTKYQPSTLIVKNEFVPADIFNDQTFLAPDDENIEGVTKVENWGLLSVAGETDATQMLFSVLTFYKDSGATFLMSLSDFDEVVTTNIDLLTTITAHGGKFAVDCNNRELAPTMSKLSSSSSLEKFFEIAHALIPLAPETTSKSSSFTDGSPSTDRIMSVIKGDNPETPGGFSVCKWKNGITYTGFWKNYKFHGLGSKMYSKGGGYLGSWDSFNRIGSGISLYQGKFGYDRWAGDFVDDKP
eukprot:CAMPEP_0118633116 /NCGR_PEP_ID=MMETSP0785-20121206/817_1 /TAXON_ID=91992 /ORGANISM="Bolidomonas pacifica, Strain CCMP 1866" /LENGTH=435 /DNA_ID=CAMNT_0006523953 /DNA_START=283 /DNA_END=1587 /DNA_ORIENTATION=+